MNDGSSQLDMDTVATNTKKTGRKFPRQHICKDCGAGFGYLKNLNVHIRNAHSGECKYTCTECGKGSGTAKALKDHQRRTHNTPTLKCDICGDNKKPFKSVTSFSNHMKIYHSERKCSRCSQICKDKEAYYKHYKKTHDKTIHKDIQCRHCPMILKGGTSFKRHQLAHHTEVAVNEDDLTYEVTVHQTIPTFEVPVQMEPSDMELMEVVIVSEDFDKNQMAYVNI